MIQVRHYHIDDSYSRFLKSKEVKLKSDFLDTHSVDLKEVGAILDGLEERFPGYQEKLKTRRKEHSTPDWEIYNVTDRTSRTIIANLTDCEGYIPRNIESHDYDLILASGWPVMEEGFDIALLDAYESFGFSNPLDFVMTLGSLKSKNVLSLQKHKEYSWTNDSFRTVISADMHGDLQIEQREKSETINVSPFGGVVPFKPMDNKILRTYFHTECSILGLMLSYIEQLGLTEEKFGEGYIGLKDDLEQGDISYGPYANAGDYDISRTSFTYQAFRSGIPKMQDTFERGINPNPTTDKHGKGYYFYAGNDDRLYVYEGPRGNQDYHMVFDHADAEHMIRGLIGNSKQGVGRTGVGELTELINAINRGYVVEPGEFDI